MRVERDASLQKHNTFGLKAKTPLLAHIEDETDLDSLFSDKILGYNRPFILGGGSNIVFCRDIDGIVLKMETKGRRVVSQNEDRTIVEVEAGEDWTEFIEWTLEQGLPGLENLAGIPGTAGAAPVQNIGAYGSELKDFFHELDAIHPVTGQRFTLNGKQCAFGYRDSIFKYHPDQRPGGLRERAIILRLRLSLPRRWRPQLNYIDLQERVANSPEAEVTPRLIFDWVLDIRSQKLPDPVVVGNVGCFFKNPSIEVDQFTTLKKHFPNLPGYQRGSMVKVPAGWLVESCGWRGQKRGRVGVYEKQALILVNLGTPTDPPTCTELLDLAGDIQAAVMQRFDIALEIEPRII